MNTQCIMQSCVTRKVNIHLLVSMLLPLAISLALALAIVVKPTVAQPISNPSTIDSYNQYPAELLIESSHAGRISALALSTDGQFLVSADEKNIIRIWDTQSNRELRRIQLRGTARAMTIAQDQLLLYTADDSGDVRSWNMATGSPVQQFTSHSSEARSIAISADGHFLASGGGDGIVRISSLNGANEPTELSGFESSIEGLYFTTEKDTIFVVSGTELQRWNVSTTEKIDTVAQFASGIVTADVSRNGKLAVLAQINGDVTAVNTITKYVINKVSIADKNATSVAISRDNNHVYLTYQGADLKVWSFLLTNEVKNITLEHSPQQVLTSNIENLLYVASNKTLEAINTEDAKSVIRFGDNTNIVGSIAFSPNGEQLLIGSGNKRAILWNLPSGKPVQIFSAHDSDVRAVAFSPDGEYVVTGSRHNTKLWRTVSGELVHTFYGSKDKPRIRPVAFSPDGSQILSGDSEGNILLWAATPPYNLLKTLDTDNRQVNWASFDPNFNHIVATSGADLLLWNAHTGELVRRLRGHERVVNWVSFSPDGTQLISASWDGTARIWNVASGLEQFQVVKENMGIVSAAWSPDASTVAVAYANGSVETRSSHNGDLVTSYKAHTAEVPMLAFSPNSPLLAAASWDHSSSLLDTRSNSKLANLVTFTNGSWAITDSEGRYDATDGGDIEGLYWVIGTQALALAQLKQRYYEPGLLSKLTQFNSEPLTDVIELNNPKLFPSVKMHSIDSEKQNLIIDLEDRGGGIGEIIVRVNGRIIEHDSVLAPLPSHNGKYIMTIPLAGHPYILPGNANEIEVVAFNKEGYLSSRGFTEILNVPNNDTQSEPTLWAIVVGTSDYKNEKLNLRYAAKDAADFATVLELAGLRFPGIKHLNLRLIASKEIKDAHSLPSKSNIQAAFKELEAAKSKDLIVVYFAGHGVAIDRDYYYLTQNAASTNLRDESARTTSTISSHEILDWLKHSAALKQVVILDTCAAGQISNDMADHRGISTGQIRAIERLNERTGTYVLMGSAANAVSYETTMYEQGLLTYALLTGLRGPALRENEFVDVQKLFEFAVDAVPQLAQEINGIQQPRMAIKSGRSFDIGQLTPQDRAQIPNKSPKPILLNASFLNKNEHYDNKLIGEKLAAHFRDRSHKAAKDDNVMLPIVYVDATQLQGAIKPSGSYTVEDHSITLDLVLRRNNQLLKSLNITITNKLLDNSIEDIAEVLIAETAALGN